MPFATTTAAVCREFGRPLEVEQLDLLEPAASEILVRIDAASICHTDISLRSGALPVRLPMVLGHEGTGIVEHVGSAVTRVKPGDRVVLSWVPQCGDCYFCNRGQAYLCETNSPAVSAHGVTNGETRLRSGSTEIRQLSGLGTFSTRLVAMQDAAVPVPTDLPAAVASIIGCSVLTGFGAAVNTADIAPGDTVVVIGVGAIGQMIIQGAVLCGAQRIIAVDANDEMRARALDFGASHFVTSGDDMVQEILDTTDGRGADVVLEAVGRTDLMTSALAVTRRGGELIVVGMPRHDATWTIAPMPQFIGAERRIKGCRYGSSVLARDVPRVLKYYYEGRLRLNDMVGNSIRLIDINTAMDSPPSQSGRTIIKFD